MLRFNLFLFYVANAVYSLIFVAMGTWSASHAIFSAVLSAALIWGWDLLPRPGRKERKSEAQAQAYIIDQSLYRIEKCHRESGARRAVDLAMLKMHYILPPELQDELDRLAPDYSSDDTRRAAE